MEISKAYEPQSVEARWYDFWLEQQCFTADPARVSATRQAYCLVIPPPNVTGVLTMGHVLNNTLQDILARKARMDGKEVLWLPGTDHAGIATQNVVEKALKKSGEIRHRDDLGREALVARIWEWKEKYGGIILQQLRALGASCDWSRTRFTMDPEYSRCVQRVFVDLYRKGLIYRGKRMVNWCPASLTAISDEEVVMKEQKGFLYHFRVEVVDVGQASLPASAEGAPGNSGHSGRLAARPTGTFLTIATTRPETIPADTAVAVNPKDPRYQHLIGKHVIRALPLEAPWAQRLIPIIADDHVAFDFGTGVLKVTPAHDKADFEIGLRHQLPVIEVLTPDGKMTAEAGADLAGLDRIAARKKAAEILEAAGALEKVEPYVNNVGFSERADVAIEPRLSEQWFLKYPSVEQARACVAMGSAPAPGAADRALAVGSARVESNSAGNNSTRAGVAGGAPSTAREGAGAPQQMRFFPDRWAKVYDHWMRGIQDWCISRQLWWGHRIPVWTIRLQGNDFTKLGLGQDDADFFADEFAQNSNDGGVFLVHSFSGGAGHSQVHIFPTQEGTTEVRALTETDSEAQALTACGFTQDPDVLDTWFSSWLWPFATMGWTGDPETDAKNPTLKTFYPTTDLVTGPDIIFFWVARMIMAGYEYLGDLPFRNVYFTGIIRDKQGRKMSKSLGNSPDPLDLIAKYGADALRFGVMRAAPLGQDILFDEQSVELGRNFCNKLWNACRYRQLVGAQAEVPPTASDSSLIPDPSSFQTGGEIDPPLLTSDDKWILLRLDQAIREVTHAFAEYKFSDATATLYRFFWSEYCDWYLEASKAAFAGSRRGDEADEPSRNPPTKVRGETGDPPPDLDGYGAGLRANKLAVIDFVLGHLLRLFHPFLPFITEELWQGMGFSADLPANQGGQTIQFAPWPKALSEEEKTYFGLDDAADKIAQAKYDLVSLGRGLRRDCTIDPAKRVRFVLRPAGSLAPNETEVLKHLLNAESLLIEPGFAAPKGTPMASNALGDLFLPLEGLVDVAAERTRLTKELEKIRTEIGKVEAKLANPAFTQKVPPNVLAEHQQRLLDWQAREKQVLAALDNLAG